MKITHYDLFAGIGGFSLTLDTIFNEHEIKHIFCEWEAFPTAVLKKHWPEGIYYGDIADLITDTDSKGRKRLSGEDEGRRGQPSGEEQNEEQEMVILTGGFPCQPFSQAGRRQGTSDDRYKWPDMLRVIQNVKPDWVIAENVRGLVTWSESMVLETVCAELENEGYEVQPFIIPAVAVGAPHRRDRVWIIARNTNSDRCTGRDAEINTAEGREQEQCDAEGRHREIGEITPNTRQQLRSKRSIEGMETDTTIRTSCAVPDKRSSQPDWSRDWREVALATCHDGVDDGLPRQMGGVTISAAKHRTLQLKAYGNAIVPQVTMEIFKVIKTSL